MLRVVLVDDQPVFREVVLMITNSYVDLVAEVATYDEALEAVKNHRPHGVIVDVNILGGDGFRLARELFQYDPSIKIILTSSSLENAYAEMANDIPNTQFVPKVSLTGQLIKDIVGERGIQ